MKLKRRKKWLHHTQKQLKKQKLTLNELSIIPKEPMVRQAEQKEEAVEIIILELLKEYRPTPKAGIGLEVLVRNN
jgi:hypothetical protein